jgi:hypothetical protein
MGFFVFPLFFFPNRKECYQGEHASMGFFVVAFVCSRLFGSRVRGTSVHVLEALRFTCSSHFDHMFI